MLHVEGREAREGEAPISVLLGVLQANTYGTNFEEIKKIRVCEYGADHIATADPFNEPRSCSHDQFKNLNDVSRG
jgi:hypothetical protein